jgi:hypothetical protein
MWFLRIPSKPTNSPSPPGDGEARFQVTSAIYWLSDGQLLEPGLSGPEHELVLLIEVRTDPAQPLFRRGFELTVELLRGEQVRDRCQQTLGPEDRGRWSFAFRLNRGASSTASSRLIARILIDSLEVARSEVLLGCPEVDAQGRFPDEPGGTASPQTLLSFEHEFRKLLGFPIDPFGEPARDRPEKNDT